MPPVIYLIGLIIVVCHAQMYLQRSYANANLYKHPSFSPDNFYSNRRERAVIDSKRLTKMGFAVIKKLLDGAVEIPSSNEFRRSYKKRGGIRQMMQDFNNFIYDDVKKVTMKDGVAGRVGKIADRVIITKTKGSNGLPTIEILRMKDTKGRKLTGRQFDAVRDEITYMN